MRDGAVPDPNANANIIGAMEDGAIVVRMLRQAYFINKQTGQARGSAMILYGLVD